jgi:hypothetical protein
LNKLLPSYLEVDAVDQVQCHGLIWFDLFHPQSVQLPICRNIKVRKTSFGIFWNIKTKRGSCIVITNYIVVAFICLWQRIFLSQIFEWEKYTINFVYEHRIVTDREGTRPHTIH